MSKTFFKDFKWLNESSIRYTKEGVMIKAPGQSDFFRGTGVLVRDNAPFYYTEIFGDFVFRAKVSHTFQDTFDAATIMLMENDSIWAKACFEKTDFDTNAVVSVVTNPLSDDANGCNIQGNEVWLQAARVGNTFAFHYSIDGIKFDMMRYFILPVSQTIKVGLVAQAPIGKGGERYFEKITLEHRTVLNIRAGR